MIEYLVLIILVLFLAFLIFTFSTYINLALNAVLLIIFAILIFRDLKRKEMVRYYLISLLITSIILIFSWYGMIETLIHFLSKTLQLSIVTITLIFLFLFANLGIYLYELGRKIKRKYT